MSLSSGSLGPTRIKAKVEQYRRINLRGTPVIEAALRDKKGIVIGMWRDDGTHKDMRIGAEYSLEGDISSVSGRRFMRQPQYSLVKKPKKSIFKRVAKITAGFFVLAAINGLASSSGDNVNKAVVDPTSSATTSIGTDQSGDEQSTAQAAEKLTPDDCDLKDVPYTSTTRTDATKPAGQKTSSPYGVKGLDKVCYVHGRSQAPTISHVVAPVDEVVVVGTYVKPLPPPPPAYVSTPSPSSYAPCSGYVNVDGNCIPSPSASGGVQGGYSPTYTCRDGTYSYAQHRQGACSSHGGIR